MLKSVFVATTLLASAYAQSTGSVTASRTTQSQSMPASATAGFNPTLVNSTTTSAWCRSQINTCTDICRGPGSTAQNGCNEQTLQYNCVCSNGTVPDCSAFTGTIPFFECQQTYIQCLDQHPSTDRDGQQTCIDNQKCGTRNATGERYPNGISSPGASTSGGSASSTSSASATGASTSSTSRAAAAIIGPVSNGAFVTVLLALCKYLL